MAATPAMKTEAIKSKRERMVIEAKLKEARELNATMHSISNSAKTGRLDILKKELVDDMINAGAEKLEFEDMHFAVFSGKNVTYSREKLQRAMMEKGVKIELQQFILESGKTETPYTTLTMRATGGKE